MASTKRRLFKKSKQQGEIKTASVKPQKKQKIQVQHMEKVSPSTGSEKKLGFWTSQNDGVKTQFPKIYRVIPERLGKLTTSSVPPMRLKWVLVAVLVVLALFWNWFVFSSLVKVGKNWLVLLEKRQQLANQMAIWESISQKYPTYRDAYVEGAMYAYRLGDRTKEQYFLQQLQLLDPNFPLTKTLEQLMNLQTTAGN